jgi:hypothetical protein
MAQQLVFLASALWGWFFIRSVFLWGSSMVNHYVLTMFQVGENLLLIVGPFHVFVMGVCEPLSGAQPVDVESLKELYGSRLYGLLGIELHSQQQGQSHVYYQGGFHVIPTDMKDTCGEVGSEVMLQLIRNTKDGEVLTKLGHLVEDGEVIYPPYIEVINN